MISFSSFNVLLKNYEGPSIIYNFSLGNLCMVTYIMFDGVKHYTIFVVLKQKWKIACFLLYTDS